MPHPVLSRVALAAVLTFAIGCPAPAPEAVSVDPEQAPEGAPEAAQDPARAGADPDRPPPPAAHAALWSAVAAFEAIGSAEAAPLVAEARAASKDDPARALALLRAAAELSLPSDLDRAATARPDRPAGLAPGAGGASDALIRGARLGSVGATAYSLDGRLLATGSSDGTIRIWEARDHSLRHILRGHIEDIECLAFSPDGTKLASASRDAFVRVWDVEGGSLRHELRGHQDSVEVVAWSPDGAILASGAWDGRVVLWEGSSDRRIRTLEGHSEGLFAIAFSPDGTKIATGSADTTARIWSVSDGATLAELVGHGGFIYATAFSPDGTLVATAGRDGATRIWSAADGAEVRMMNGDGSHVFATAFSEDGKQLVSTYWDGSGAIFDVATGREVRSGRAAVGADVVFREGRIALALGPGAASGDAAGVAGELTRLIASSGSRTTLRVCRTSRAVVDVPGAAAGSVWAPAERCR